MKGHRVAAFGCPHPLPAKVTCSRLKRAWLLVTAPVRRWQSRQWNIEMRDGSPSILRTSCPQLQAALRVIMELHWLSGFLEWGWS